MPNKVACVAEPAKGCFVPSQIYEGCNGAAHSSLLQRGCPRGAGLAVFVLIPEPRYAGAQLLFFNNVPAYAGHICMQCKIIHLTSAKISFAPKTHASVAS